MSRLAKLVLDWAKADEAISKHGWDGGEFEKAWEVAKTKMIEEAMFRGARELVMKNSGEGEALGFKFSILDGHEPIINPRGEKVGDAVASFCLIGEDTGGVTHDTLLPVPLTVNNVFYIMAVLAGVSDKIVIDRPISGGLRRELHFGHEGVGSYGAEVHVNGDWPYFNKMKSSINAVSAYGLSKALDGVIGELAFS